ncbi:g10856 [Coccomyxa viridis]|uniref:DNA damage-binding protein 1 n=1 Tax=Coccomyxa viridis TaxID=1274662 RepID=A0ABP1GCB9_9CHLO
MSTNQGSAWNYVVTAHKPTNVTHSVVGHFTSPKDINLIISKCTRIEIHTLSPEGLKGVVDVAIYGRIATLELFRPTGESKDLLFLSTERCKFCVLEYNSETGELMTRASGDVKDRVGRPVENGQIGIIDPWCRMIGLHLYDGLFKVIPIDEKGQLQEASNIRIDELNVLDMKFLEATLKPTLVVLYQDSKEARHVKTYEVNIKDKELTEGPWRQSNLDAGASMIITVPAPMGGAIVVGESVVAYIGQGQQMKCTEMTPTIIRAFGKVDEDGSRYLLGDHLGNLLLLVLQHDGSHVVGLKTEPLGCISAPSTISYLDNGVVYVGSSFGDSQLVRLHAEPVNPAEPNNFVEVLESMTNLGPIIDFVVVDLERQGQGQVVMCSGVMKDGSLRIVRNGIGMIEQASVELPGIKGMWNLRATNMDAFDKYLVLSFVGETRVLAINEDDELDEAEVAGFNQQSQTLCCANTLDDGLLQVTPQDVRVVDAGTGALVHQWKAPAGLQINTASASPTQVVLATGEGNLVCLDVTDNKLTEKAHVKLNGEVSCIDITPLDDAERSQIAAVGTWDMQVHILSLPDLSTLRTEKLGGEVIPRSVLLAVFEDIPYLLCALGDGQLFNWQLDSTTGELRDKKKICLGTKPIMLRSFRSNGVSHVFAASDRPTVIYSSNKKLHYSNVNEDEVNFMSSFNSSSFPDSLALSKEASMSIGSIDEIQKLHIRTVPLGEQPRRLAHQEPSRTFAVLTSPTQGPTGVDDMAGSDTVRLVDDQTFEMLDRFGLEPMELGVSLASMAFAEDDRTYYVIGTAFTEPDEAESKKGRILVFMVKDFKLQLVSEREVKGAVYNVNPFQGKLIAGINSKVQLYKWLQTDDGSRELQLECSHTGHVLALYIVTRGDFVIVGDLMRSMQLLIYRADEQLLEVRARDFKTHWMTAVEVLDDDTYLGAENSFNLFTLRKNSDAASDEDRNRLEMVGQYHLGEFVNKFRHGCLVMKLPDSEAATIPTVLFGTINGTIGVLASLPQEQFKFMERLQDCLRRVIKGVGGFSHADWRAFQNEHTSADCRNFVDGDLIEQFLDLKRESMERIAKDMGSGVTVEELMRTVEDLSRSCH